MKSSSVVTEVNKVKKARKKALEELSEDEEESIDVINDLADINYDSEDEQHQLAELISGLASQLGDNEVANAFFSELDSVLEDVRDALQDQFEVDFDTVGE